MDEVKLYINETKLNITADINIALTIIRLFYIKQSELCDVYHDYYKDVVIMEVKK